MTNENITQNPNYEQAIANEVAKNTCLLIISKA